MDLCHEFFHNYRQIVLLHHLLIDGSCRSYLIMAFDTVKQSWRNLSQLMSIQFLSRTRTEMGDNVTEGCGCGFAFATSFPCTSVLNACNMNFFWRSGHVGRQIPFTIRTQETVLSRNKGSIHPLTRDASSLRCNVYPRHRVFISCGPSSSNVTWKFVLFQQSFKRRRSTVWKISGLQEVVRIYVHNLAANFPAIPRWCEDKHYEVL